ncbi:hypothetical protein J6590_106617, partial [Homalodisca vitripennis]
NVILVSLTVISAVMLTERKRVSLHRVSVQLRFLHVEYNTQPSSSHHMIIAVVWRLSQHRTED